MIMNRIRVYGFEGCPYCKELMEMYDKHNIEYYYIDVDLDENAEETEKIMEIGQTDSVPIILVNNTLLSPENSFKSIKEAYQTTLKFLK